jgi:hypothetical protein
VYCNYILVVVYKVIAKENVMEHKKKRFIETKYLDIYIITYDVGHYEGHTLLFIQIMLCRFCWLFFFFLLVFFSPFSTAAVDFLLSSFFHSFGFLFFFSLFTQESLHAGCLVIFFFLERKRFSCSNDYNYF